MLNDTVQITTPQDTITDKIPADLYQIVLTNVVEADGSDYNTGEPKKQLKFYGEIVEGEEKGKTISFFTSLSWFNGGKGAKPSKLFNLVKNIYAFYETGMAVSDMPIITPKDINSLMGKQIRVTVDENEKGWPKVVAFTPIKKEIEYSSSPEDVNIDEVPDFLK